MITGNTYYDKLPVGYVVVESLTELFELIPRRKKFIKANLQLIDSPIVLFSDWSDRYYMRHSRASPESHIRPFCKNKALYIPESLKLSQGAIQEREAMLMLEYYTADKSIVGRETRIKMLKQKLKELKDGTDN